MAATDSTAAQDPGEMFDVMEPPPSQWDPPTSRPVGTGAIKARGSASLSWSPTRLADRPV